MLKIHQLFFVNTLVLFLVTLTIGSSVGYYALKEMIIEDHTNNLKRSIELIFPLAAQSHDSDSLAYYAHNLTDYRVTVFDLNGNVLAESNIDKRLVESAKNRKEVMNAQAMPYGEDLRYSSTFKQESLFVAKKMILNNKFVIIRLGVSLSLVMDHFYTLWLKLAASFVMMIIIALLVSYKISKKVQCDIDQITQFLDEVSKKNYNATLKPEFLREFLYVTLLLKNLVKKLRNRDKQKQKHTARLRLINKQQNDVLSAISHEFKNPIAAIVGYTETLKEDMELNLEIREKFLGKIHTNALKMSSMLDRLALSVKLENNDFSIKPTLFDLSLLCRDVASTLQGKYPKRTLTYVGESLMIKADKTMMDLVIMNLSDNALKYSEDNVEIVLEHTSLRIIDHGIGIAPHELELISTKFYRVQKNSWDNSMGLGLSIVSYILKLHNTSLEISSVQGEGSTFGFSLAGLVAK